MPDISTLIKPASSLCNLRCKYCFYHDEAGKRAEGNRGIMSETVRKALVSRAIDESGGRVSFSFQGGEPTMAGIEWFEGLHRDIDEHKKVSGRENISCSFAIQTNGIKIAEDERWAKLFAEHKYLVGLSVDGTKELHDGNRVTPDGSGTFLKVCRCAEILARYKVDFNILTVVNAACARHIAQIYDGYKKRGWDYMQFIPCLDPLGEKPFERQWSLTPQRYLSFSRILFDRWHSDNLAYFKRETNRRISVRRLDNLLQIALGGRAEACGMNGCCSIQFVTEADGSVYPCDFFALDEYRLGNIAEKSFAELYEGETSRSFVTESRSVSEKCRSCPVWSLCTGGCRRYKYEGEYIYCEAEREFLTEIREKLLNLANTARGSGLLR